MLYNPIKLDISRKQDDRLKLAISRGNAVSIKVMIRDEEGEHTVLLTRGQIAKIERARLIGKRHITIRLSRKQVQANIKYEGGFLGMLASLAARVLPTLLTGLAAGLVSGAVEKAVGGSGGGLYLQKKGQCANVQFVKGGGLYLTPHHPPQQSAGEGLYLRHGDAVYGEGLLLGPNSPFKNIPILGLIL